MNIGQAAKISGISAKMIRYYETLGLIGPPRRSAAGYRLYTEQDIHTLLFIRRARALGFSMENIRELLQLWQDRSRKSSEVKQLASSHIETLNRRITELQSIVDTLQGLAACCAGDERPDCPILADMGACPSCGPFEPLNGDAS